MVIKNKGTNKQLSERRAPRFDFGRDGKAGTIEELLSDISDDYKVRTGEPVTYESLRKTLAFIRNVTGVSIQNNKKPIPLVTLKVIKLLFLKNVISTKHLFRQLELPRDGEETMEFSTFTTISRDQGSAGIIDSIANALALEIPHEKLTLLSQMLGDSEQHSASEKLLLYIGRASDDVGRILSARFQDDVMGLANAYHALARAMPTFEYDKTAERLATPVHEAIFVYLNTLAFKHFVPHHRRHVKTISIKAPIKSIADEAEALLVSINSDGLQITSPYEKCFSVNNFHSVVFGYPKEIAALVEKATGQKTRKYRLFRNTVRASPLLYAYGFRSYNEDDPAAPILSLIDIVAALSSFSYQQKVNTKYKPYWHGQVTQGEDPQSQWDRGWWQKEKNNRNSKYEKGYADQHQHQGVFQLYYYRFCEFQAVFTDTKASYHGWMAYQLARLEAYKRLVQSNDINEICTAATRLDLACVEAAMNIACDFTKSKNGSVSQMH